MSSDNSRNRWIFREGRSGARGESVRAGVSECLARLREPTRDRLVDALLRAGELETALADAACADARVAADITQSVAGALVGSDPVHLPALSVICDQLRVPDAIHLSVAEGFAYYALHPLAYAGMVEAVLPGLASLAKPRAAVIGIRSIGATLSAVVTAALAKNGIHAERITVRPQGEFFDRKTQFSAEQLRWIGEAPHYGAEFFVVDEGPGLSGSSFLSVGEALLSAGVERRRIRLLCSYEADADGLMAPRGAERWRRFRSHWPGPHRAPQQGLEDISAGRWREVLFPHLSRSSGGEAPRLSAIPSWIQMERVKYLSSDGSRLFKFAGLGRYGEAVSRRAELLAASGFGPRYLGITDGYAEYEVLKGRPARHQDLTRAMVERLADYCAMRASEFRVESSDSKLESMARYNYEAEFGEAAPDFLRLPASNHTVICDARIHPHEWVLSSDGIAYKTDGDMHGDDHFFPGPCDIAWDLAGAIVEWQMDSDAAQLFLRRYHQRSGDDAPARIAPFLLAYAVFRSSWCTMAASGLRGTPEEAGLRSASYRYRAIARRLKEEVANSAVVGT